eukprot:1463486-Amphidinium_carterae.1
MALRISVPDWENPNMHSQDELIEEFLLLLLSECVQFPTKDASMTGPTATKMFKLVILLFAPIQENSNE